MFPVDVVVRDGKLLVWTEREWKWFLIPQRPRLTTVNVDLWSGPDWMWQVAAPAGSSITLPIAYGEARKGVEVLHPPRRLEPGKTYMVRVDTATLAFRLTQSGTIADKYSVGWPNDPDQRVLSERRDRRIGELRAAGYSEEEAYALFNKDLKREATQPRK
nr:hypothetical protein [uncultured Sphingomonas sp.]